MEKILIAYYSRTENGANCEVARYLQDKLNAARERIIDLEDRSNIIKTYFFGGIKAMFHTPGKIAKIRNNPAEFDLLILVSPIWAVSLPPAVRRYLLDVKNKVKKIAFISVSGNGEMNQRVTLEIEKMLNIKIQSFLFLTSGEVNERKHLSKLDHFIKQI